MSIPANLAVLPLVPPTFALAFLAGLADLVWPSLGAFLAVLASLGSDWIIDVVVWFSTLASPVSLGHSGEPSLLLIWLASLTVIGMVSVDSRQWSQEVAAAWATKRSSLPVFGLSFIGGALLLLLALWWR